MTGDRRSRFRSGAMWCAALGMALGTGVFVSGTAGASPAHHGHHAHHAHHAKAGLKHAQVKKLKKDLKKAQRPSKFVAPGPKLSSSKVKALSGSSVMFLGVGQNTFNTELLTGVKQAAQAVGMSVIYDNSETATSQVQDIDTAVSENAKAVILECIIPTSVSSALSKAKAAGVTVVDACTGDPRLPTSKVSNLGVFGYVTYSYTKAGKIIGEFDVLKTKGHVDAIVQYFKGLGASTDTVTGFKHALHKFCPKTCSASFTDIPLSSSTTSAISSSASAAVANPSINVFFPVYDFMVNDDEPIITSAHANTKITLGTQNADLAPMQQLAAGNTAVKAEVGDPTTWEGWASMDQALRGMTGMKPVKNEHVPTRLFDTANIKSVTLKASMTTWYGKVNYRTDYERLWGVKK